MVLFIEGPAGERRITWEDKCCLKNSRKSWALVMRDRE